MRRVILNAFTLLMACAIVIGPTACKNPFKKKSGKEKVDELSKMEKSYDDQTTVYTDDVTGEPTQRKIEKQPVLVCLAGKLNVRAGSGSDEKVVTTVSRGERMQRLDDDRFGYEEWANVRLADGTEGWVDVSYTARADIYDAFSEVDKAARSGDMNATEAALIALKKQEEFRNLTYYPSPDSNKILVNASWDSFVGIIMGYGLAYYEYGSHRIDARDWSQDSRYFFTTSGTCVMGGFSIRDAETFRSLYGSSYWGGYPKPPYEAPPDYAPFDLIEGTDIVVWVGELGENPIEYPLAGGPATKEDAARSSDVAPGTMKIAPCIYAYDCDRGVTYMVAASDSTTYRLDNYEAFVIVKPTEAFMANPLFGAVSETEVYKAWVGGEVNGFLSEGA